jgi:hypothetical protein
MNRATQEPMGGFEQRLLRELREVVAEGALPSEPALTYKGSLALGGWINRRWLIPVAAGVALTLAALVLLASPFGTSHNGGAWAVTRNDDGTVTVEIDSLRDAGGLQRELRQAGVPAEVQYLPPGKACAGETAAPGVHEGGGPGSRRARDHGQVGHDLLGGRRAVQIRTRADGGIEFTVEATAHPDETLVIRSQGLSPGQAPAAHPAAANGVAAISVTHVRGKVRPCTPIDSPTQ